MRRCRLFPSIEAPLPWVRSGLIAITSPLTANIVSALTSPSPSLSLLSCDPGITLSGRSHRLLHQDEFAMSASAAGFRQLQRREGLRLHSGTEKYFEAPRFESTATACLCATSATKFGQVAYQNRGHERAQTMTQFICRKDFRNPCCQNSQLGRCAAGDCVLRISGRDSCSPNYFFLLG